MLRFTRNFSILVLTALLAACDAAPAPGATAVVVVATEPPPAAAAQPAALPSTPTPVPTAAVVVTEPPPTTTKEAAPSSSPGIGSTMISDKDGMELVYVPAGEFLMGSAKDDPQADDDEKPRHKVYVDAYWMDKTEVTNLQFARFVEETGHVTEAERAGTGWVFTGTDYQEVNGADWRHPQGPDSRSEDSHPVVQVSWNDAKAYCEWAGRRLPTEAEWEKAARGTDARKYPWGNNEPNATLANFAMKVKGTRPVGSYPTGASSYGALDMAGNVFEWVGDWYGVGYYATAPASNPQGPEAGDKRGMRGGSWNYESRLVRPALRNGGTPDTRSDPLGFRCARSY